MAAFETKSDPLGGSPTPKTETRSVRVTWPATWGITLLAIWLIVWGLVILLAPGNAVLVALSGIVAIAAGILLFIGK